MAIQIHQLKKQYVGPDGSVVPVIDIADFALGDAEQTALIGSSGSGKTTLLHMIAGIVRPDWGNIYFGTFAAAGPQPQTANKLDYYTNAPPADAIDLTALSEAQRDVFRGLYIGYIFQTHHLLSGFTAMENVLLGMSFTGRKPDRAWAMHLLNEVGLGQRLEYRPQKLSLGQQQRVAVARALANRPRLVLADEPTGALDQRNAQQVLELIRRLCSEVGASLLLVSHDLNIARQLGRVVDLSQLNRVSYQEKAAV
jgi:putative ABC transport system ATP-binding protein